MARTDIRVDELIQQYLRRELALPEMQRRYVWPGTRVRDLLDSLYRGYPAGTILVWETTEDVALRDAAVEQEAPAFHAQRLLLDGQQRITSLAAVLAGKPVTVRGRKKPVEILFNLDHPDELEVVTEVDDGSGDDASDEDELADNDAPDSDEEELLKRFEKMAFVVGTKRLAQLPNWVSVSEVFKDGSDRPFLKKAGVADFNDPRYDKYSSRLERLREIRNYLFGMEVLPSSMNYDEVTEVFVRVNSLGAKLRGSDLALAQVTAKWRNSLAIFEKFDDSCAAQGFDFDLSLHIRNLVVIATAQSRFRRVRGMSSALLENGWSECRPAMEYALSFLKSNAQIDSPALLSSPYLALALALAYFGHKRMYQVSQDEAEALRRWVLLANAKGRYSRSSSETLLDEDLAVLRADGSVDGLIERLRRQVGTLEVTPSDLEGRNKRSAFFKTMFLAFRANGAKDWHSNVGIALDHPGQQQRLQCHHIFPKAHLDGVYKLRQVNDIANLAFIAGRANRKISASDPSKYIPELLERHGDHIFRAQCVPTDPALLPRDCFPEFLAERRRLIAIRLNEFLSVASLPST